MRREEKLGSLLFALIVTALVVVITVSIFTAYSVMKIEERVDDLERRLEKVKADLSDRIGRVEDLIGPNSPIDKYINDLSYVKGLLSDLKNIERILSELPEDPTSGYFRVLVIGSEKVWFEVGKGKKRYFADELFPGLSPQRFYYFKPPNVELDYVVPIPPDSYVTIGKPGRVFLVFFGVGIPGKRPVKIVKLDKNHYESLKDAFNLYIPR